MLGLPLTGTKFTGARAVSVPTQHKPRYICSKLFPNLDCRQVGDTGSTVVEESQTLGDEVEFTEGLTIDRGFLSPYFISDQERSLCEYKNPKVGVVAAGGWGLEAPWDGTVRGHVVVFQTRCSSWRTKIRLHVNFPGVCLPCLLGRSRHVFLLHSFLLLFLGCCCLWRQAACILLARKHATTPAPLRHPSHALFLAQNHPFFFMRDS